MTIENQTFDAIHARLLANVDDTFDKRQGSVVYDLTGPTAAEAELIYALMATLLDRGFADTATGSDLDRRVAEQGLTRKPAVKGMGNVVFSGTDGYTIAAGTVVSTALEVRFSTDVAASITGGSATVPVTALVGGSTGNVDIGAITTLDGVLAGITGVTNAVATSGGVDEESDLALFARYSDKVSKPATSGNANHYRQLALEVSGVTDAKVFPLFSGAGTVKISIMADNGQTASTALVNAVASHIEEMRPIGATVTVNAATITTVNVAVSVKFNEAYAIADVKAEITDRLSSYITGLGLGSGAVRYSAIMREISNVEGVDYCNTLKINGSAADLTLAADAAPVVGSVTVSAE